MFANFPVQVASALTSTGWATFHGLRGVRRELHVLQRSLGKAQPLQHLKSSAAHSRDSRTLNPLGTAQARAWSFQVRLLAMPACGGCALTLGQQYKQHQLKVTSAHWLVSLAAAKHLTVTQTLFCLPDWHDGEVSLIVLRVVAVLALSAFSAHT